MASNSVDRMLNVTPDNEFARKLFENTGIYASYETSDPAFDKSNLNKFAGHLPCPRIDKEMIFRFLDFGNQQNWGKRKATTSFCVAVDRIAPD